MTALVIGRFQPLHPGHIYLFKEALKVASKIIIAIGSVGTKNVDNPFSLEERTALLNSKLTEEGLLNFVDKIVDIHDYPDDDVWLQELLKKTGPVVVVVGNNDWVNGIFRQAGYRVVEIPLLKRDVYQGKVIRERMRREGKL